MSTTITSMDLANFTGTEQWFKHPLFSDISYTDGVQYIGLNGASWLVTDILAHLKCTPKIRKEEFVAITLKVDTKEKTAVLTFTDGNEKALARQKYDFTDLEIAEVKFFYTNNVLMLASEY